MRMRYITGSLEMGWLFSPFGSSRMVARSLEGSAIDPDSWGEDDDEKLTVFGLGMIVANTALALALCVAVHWAALAWPSVI